MPNYTEDLSDFAPYVGPLTEPDSGRKMSIDAHNTKFEVTQSLESFIIKGHQAEIVISSGIKI